MSEADWPSIQLEKLRHRLRYCYERSEFYRRLWGEVGIDDAWIDSLQNGAEFSRQMPFTTKQMILDDQASEPPFGGRLCVAESELVAVSSSGGTSGGRRELQPLTRIDVVRASRARTAFAGCWTAGLRPGGVVPVLFPVGPAGGTWFPLDWIKQVGARPLMVMQLPTREKLEEMVTHRATFLGHVLPSYLNVLAIEARNAGIDPRRDLTSLAGIMLAGESYPVAWLEAMSDFWGVPIHENYGSTQATGHHAWTCERGLAADGRQRGVLHVDELSFYTEVLRPGTSQPVQPGERGELVITTLDAVAAPYMRYRTGDSAVYLGESVCPCGRAGACIEAGTIGRIDDQVKIKGNVVTFTAIESIVFETPGVKDFRMRIGTSADGRTKVGLTLWVSGHSDRSIEKDVATRLHGLMNVSIDVARARESQPADANDSAAYKKVQRIADARRIEFPDRDGARR
ncbi:phenylacetate--CoA ligase family protein [Nocardioides caldifontis]|uniref:phenylacetate--CoA ligase family protein n=1 Tax=Nocardioides caldifontis TaxID=2588938 RepID=UPI001396A669|nr:AMP-binding protein [Nocardioides caldifontis]